MKRFLFVGEKPSHTAFAHGWTWRDGRLAAATLFRAMEAAGLKPLDHSFINLFGDKPDNREVPACGVLGELENYKRLGFVMVAMGRKVQRQLRIAGHSKALYLRHPAARGRMRAAAVYADHVKQVLS